MPSPDPFAPLLALPGVFEAMEAARSAVDSALRHERIRRRHDPAVTAAALAAAAAASAELEELDPVGEPLLALTLQTAPLGRTAATAPLQAITRMHLLAGGAEPGIPRVGADTGRLAALARDLTVPTQAPALLVAAVAHGELLAVAPFADRNGAVARQFSRSLLVQRALDSKAITVPEAGHLAELDEYTAASAGYASGDPDGVARWLIHCAHAMVLGARAARDLCDTIPT